MKNKLLFGNSGWTEGSVKKFLPKVDESKTNPIVNNAASMNLKVDLHDLTVQGQLRIIRKRTRIRTDESVNISEAYISDYDQLIQDVRVGTPQAYTLVMWDCNSAAFTNERKSYLHFEYYRKKVQVRMLKEVLRGLLDQDIEVKRIMVGKPYIEEGEAKQEVTVVSIDRFWTVIWNCNEGCFDVTKKDIELIS